MRAWLLASAVLLVPAPAVATEWRALVVNNEHPSGNSVSVVDTDTDTVATTVDVGVTPFGAAVTPDGARAVVANFGNAPGATPSLQPIDLAAQPPAAGTAIPAGSGNNPSGVAVTPDGTAAYSPAGAGNALLKLDLQADPPALSSIPLDRRVDFLAITPDGRKAYVTSGTTSSVVPVDLTTGTAGTAITVGASPRGIAVTPDGTRVLVSVNGIDQVRLIDTATDAVLAGGIAVAGANDIAITPDGKTAWVTTWNGTDEDATQAEDGFVVPVDIPTASVGAPVDLKVGGAGQGWGVAITPDGRKLYASDGRFGSPNGVTVRPVDLTASPPQAGAPIAVETTPRTIVITPDQAPVASLNIAAAPPGSPTQLDASGSTSATSDIASYDWDFGDGTTATTGTPTTTHTYASTGSRTVSVTATTEGGTSTERVYTGKSVMRNGGPQARATRALDVTTAPRPSLALDPALLDFGTVGLGRTAARTTTIRNVGTAALTVSQVSADGDFAVTADGCGTVAAGATCSIAVRVTPSARGERRGGLRIESDAPGGPHVVTLLVVGTDRGVLRGRVLDPRGRPQPGTLVQSCIDVLATCRRATAGPDGAYRLVDLPAGAHTIRAFPLSRDLAPGDATADVLAAEERDRDVVVRALPALSRRLSLLTPSGLFTSGRPSVWWGDPLTFRLDVPDVPAEAEPGTRYRIRVVVQMTSAGFTETWERTVVATYGDDRRIASLSEERAPQGPRARAAQSAACDSLYQDALKAYAEMRNEELRVTREVLGVNLPISVHMDPDHPLRQDYEKKLALVVECQKRPQRDLRPVPYPIGPVDMKTTTEVQKLPDGDTKRQSEDGGAYIDPSGTVRTTTGVPLERAEVVVQRREPTGAFLAVPDGSAILSPSNRTNPDRTDQLGRFGWDTLAGTYRVRATHPRCRGAAFTPGLDVPPPRLGLILRLRCRPIRRTRTRVTLQRRGPTLSARVLPQRRGRGRPHGTVTFRAGRRVIARAAVDPRTGRAEAPIRTRRVRATYSGDARFAASRSRR